MIDTAALARDLASSPTPTEDAAAVIGTAVAAIEHAKSMEHAHALLTIFVEMLAATIAARAPDNIEN